MFAWHGRPASMRVPSVVSQPHHAHNIPVPILDATTHTCPVFLRNSDICTLASWGPSSFLPPGTFNTQINLPPPAIPSTTPFFLFLFLFVLVLTSASCSLRDARKRRLACPLRTPRAPIILRLPVIFAQGLCSPLYLYTLVVQSADHSQQYLRHSAPDRYHLSDTSVALFASQT